MGDGQIKVRGNSTANGAKKPYTIKFNKKKDVLGLGSAKKWALLANCFDPSLMRNYIAFDLAHKLGLQYTPDYRLVEVWMDGSFLGCYLLAEPVEANSKRVDIDTDNSEFIVELESERYEEGTTYFTCNPKSGVTYRFAVKEPDEPTEEQVVTISEIMNSISITVCSGDYEQIQSVIDVDSFVKFYILNEYMKTVDFNYSSVFFYYKDGKLFAGPAWDFDLSSGNASLTFYAEAISNPSGGRAENSNFYKMLMKCSEFRAEVHRQLYDSIPLLYNVYSKNGVIDTLLNAYGDVFDRNYSEAGWKVGHKYSTYSRQPFATYEENVQFLRDWLGLRMEWFLGDSNASVHTDADENSICDLCSRSIISIEEAQVTSFQDCEYTGEAICPEVQLTMDELLLINGIDYRVAYENNIEEGTATVTISGIGCYVGTITESFEILPTPTDVPTPSPEVTEEPTIEPIDTPAVTTIPEVIPTEEVTTTPIVTPSATPVATQIITPTATPVATQIITPTATPVATQIITPTATPVATQIITPTAIPTEVVTIVPSVTPTVYVTPSAEPTESVTATPTSAPVSEPEDVPTQEVTPEPTSVPIKKNGVESFVERLYTMCLGREAEVEGIEYWSKELKRGTTGAVVAEGFFFSEEMSNRKLSDKEFITSLYETFMNRVPEKDGMEYWLKVIKSEDGRKIVFDGFVDSQEWADICLNYGIRSGGNAIPSFEKEASAEILAFAERLYTTCLGRDSEEAGLKYWADEIANLRQSGSEAAKGFFFSEELQKSGIDDAEFLTRLYKTLMGREPEKAGFDYWLGEIKSGRMTHESVFDGFAASPEWVDICADAGILR